VITETVTGTVMFCTPSPVARLPEPPAEPVPVTVTVALPPEVAPTDAVATPLHPDAVNVPVKPLSETVNVCAFPAPTPGSAMELGEAAIVGRGVGVGVGG
jgi:hypothetical protein